MNHIVMKINDRFKARQTLASCWLFNCLETKNIVFLMQIANTQNKLFGLFFRDMFCVLFFIIIDGTNEQPVPLLTHLNIMISGYIHL